MWHFMVIFPHFKKCSWHLKNVLYSVKKVCGGKKCLFLLKYVYEILKKYTSVSRNCPWNFQKCLYNVKKGLLVKKCLLPLKRYATRILKMLLCSRKSVQKHVHYIKCSSCIWKMSKITRKMLHLSSNNVCFVLRTN